jgi:hypothetical protein
LKYVYRGENTIVIKYKLGWASFGDRSIIGDLLQLNTREISLILSLYSG